MPGLGCMCPVSMWYALVPWFTPGWVADRIIAYRSAREPSAGRYSQICVPGILVETGLKLPRCADGASGFKSHVSCCAGPPHKKM